MMRIIYRIMIVIGVLMLVSAAGKDELYGTAYPLNELVSALSIGFALIAAGLLIRERSIR